MSIQLCLVGPAFHIKGNLSFKDKQTSFQLTFDNDLDQAATNAVQWYLDDALVPGQTLQQFNAQVPCGTHTIGVRILTNEGWSGMQYQSFETCAVTQWFNTMQSQAFDKNDCGVGFLGSSVTYTINAGAYISIISQQDADNLAIADIAANGQINANPNGTCLKVQDLGTFDYLIVKFNWKNGAGSNLDVLVGYENAEPSWTTSYYVGYQRWGTYPNINSPISEINLSDIYLGWVLDNKGDSGYESVLVNFKKYINDFSTSPEIIYIGLYAIWSDVGTGDFEVELTTYQNGIMVLENDNFINIGGILNSGKHIHLNTLIKKPRAFSLAVSWYYRIGAIRYNKITRTAVIELS